jgi:hypothetical protein
MRILFLTFFLSFLLTSIFGQVCTHDDLSQTLRIITQAKRKPGDSIEANQCPVEVTVIDKSSKKTIQQISFKAPTLGYRSFVNCNFVRSYSTGKNRNAIITDTDFGDIVVADFNFDSREDIAIRFDDENGGTYYRFYIQGKDRQFHLDSFLTDSMTLVPTYFNRTKKRLTTYQHAGAGFEGEQIYQLDVRKNKWSLIRHRFIKMILR